MGKAMEDISLDYQKKVSKDRTSTQFDLELAVLGKVLFVPYHGHKIE